jgi:hypothetical protein
MHLTSGAFEKSPGDRRWCVFDFGDIPELLAGETITGTPTLSSAPSGLVHTDVTVLLYEVGFWLSGGTASTSYDLTCNIVLSSTSVISRTAKVMVI